MTASGRQYTGTDLILPITGPATGAGWLIQKTSSPAPMPITIAGGQLNREATPSTIGLWDGAGGALQLKTSLAVQVPPLGFTVTFGPSGRSGPPTLSFCPGGTKAGYTVFNGPAPYNPNCTVVASAPLPGIGFANGYIVYTRTSNQFGGFGALAAQGTASLAVLLATAQTGTGSVAFAGDIVDIEGVGDPIDSPGGTGVLDGLVIKQLFGYTSQGLITSTGATLLAAPNLQQTAWDGLLTTGRVKVHVTANIGPAPETYTVTGSDGRNASGIGNLTMVSGTVSRTNLTGSSTTRNIVGFTITPEPTMLLGATCALGVLVVSHRVARRRS